jgi:hypothetical protein
MKEPASRKSDWLNRLASAERNPVPGSSELILSGNKAWRSRP